MSDGSGFCDKRDHDGFNIRCGYPMPCPWHTFTLDEKTGVLRLPEIYTEEQLARAQEVGSALLKGLKRKNP